MNLTKALLGTIIKYPVSSLGIDKKSGNIRTKKMGYFYADKDNFEDVQRSAGTFGMRHPLTFLLEAADDIAYKTADIEDAVKKGCISYERLLQELRGFRPEQQTEQYRRIVSWLEERFGKGVQRDYSRPDLYAVQNWVISAQGQMIAGVTDCFTANYGAIMDGSYGKDMFAGTGVELLMDALGDIAFRYAFDTRPILKLEIAAQTIFSFLLERFVDAVIPWDTDLPMTQVQNKMVSLISDNYKKIYSICSKDKMCIRDRYTTLPWAVGLALAAIILTINYARSQHGRIALAIRDHQDASELIGVNVFHEKIKSLMYSAFFCGVGGGMMAHYYTYMVPNVFNATVSNNLLTSVVLGGVSLSLIHI